MKNYQFIDKKGNVNQVIGIIKAKSKIEAIKKVTSYIYFSGNNPYCTYFGKPLYPIIIK